MRKIIVSIHSTFNDVVTGLPDDPTNFMIWAQDGIEDSLQTFYEGLSGVDAFLMGRNTVADLGPKWSTAKDWPNADALTLKVADIVNTTPKYVVASDKIEDARWGDFDPPIQLIGDDVIDQVRELKEQTGGDIMTFGSPTLVQSLINAGLVDEMRVQMHPVIMNTGGRLLENLNDRTDMSLIDVRRFDRGSMMLTYELTPSR